MKGKVDLFPQKIKKFPPKNCKNGGNSKIFGIFTPIPGEMIQFDEHSFQMGGSTTN